MYKTYNMFARCIILILLVIPEPLVFTYLCKAKHRGDNFASNFTRAVFFYRIKIKLAC